MGVSVSLFRTRFMDPAIISLGQGIHLCYWLCAIQVYYDLLHFKVRAAWWERGARESARLPYGHYLVSRAWKITSNFLFWFDFLGKRQGKHNPFFAFAWYCLLLVNSFSFNYDQPFSRHKSLFIFTFHFSLLRMGRTLKKSIISDSRWTSPF